MLFKSQFAVAALAAMAQAEWNPTGDNIGYFGWRRYRELPADVKIAELWEQCTKDTTPAEVPYEMLDDFFG